MITPTPEQRAVIDHPLEPLRVAAGAGTGKTTTIVWRLARLITSGAVTPEEALGITFTNKAAQELSDRLGEELPGLAAEGRIVEVTTYHGFAHRLLQEHGARVGVERDARLITPGYRRQLLREAFETEAAAATRLDLTAPGHRVAEAAALAEQIGHQLVDVAALLARDRAAGATDETAARRADLARVVIAYREVKRRLGAVDYADLLLLAHRLVGEHPEVAAAVRSRYGLVLLDEYQDTNPVQRELLTAVFGRGFPVTAVGDPDQTIYEWRGATLENFAGFPDHFPTATGAPATSLPLSLNRRSGHRIVDVADTIRRSIGGSGTIDRLRPRPGAGPGAVASAWFRTSVEEAMWVADEARRLVAEEGLRFGDIAVLFRKNRRIPLVRDALAAAGVPVEVVSLGGLLHVPEVADLHAWLRILGRPDDDAALARILFGPFHRLGFGDFVHLTNWTRAQPAEPDVPAWTLLEAVGHDPAGIRPEAARALARFERSYRELLELAQGLTLVELCRRILERVGFWDEVAALDDAARLSARLNLYRFLDLAESWSPLEGRPSLEAFLDYLDLLAEEDTAEELDTARAGNEDAVSLLTVHRAKGLEWNAVFVPALTEGTFPAAARAYDDPERRVWSVPYELRLDPPPPAAVPLERRNEALRTHHEAQEWRTAYVAVTRARARLYLSGAWWYTPRRPQRRSRIFDLVRPVTAVLHDHPAPGHPPEDLRRGIPAETGPDPLLGEDGWAGALRATRDDPDWPARAAGGARAAYDRRVEELRLELEGLPEPPAAAEEPAPVVSVTGLVTFAGCPLRYHWTSVEPLPRRADPAQRRGIDVHRRIELHNRGIVPLEDAAAVDYDLTAGDRSDRADAFSVFSASRFAALRPRATEVPIELSVGEARIRGRIDAVYEPEPGTWEIVDYKSGRYRPDPALRVQLQTYALAALDGAVAVPGPDRLSVTFAFLGGGELTEVREEVDDAWAAAARADVAGLLGRIGDGEREPVPGDGCTGCDFLTFCEAGRSHLGAGP